MEYDTTKEDEYAQKVLPRLQQVANESNRSFWLEYERSDGMGYRLIAKGQTYKHTERGLFDLETDIEDVIKDGRAESKRVRNRRK